MSTNRGDIVIVNLDPSEGGEKSKTRPCLVLVGEGHPWGIIIVVPITENFGRRPPKLFVAIPHPDSATGLSKKSCVDCFQIRCISTQRPKSKLGQIPQKTMDEVLARVGAILNIGEEHLV